MSEQVLDRPATVVRSSRWARIIPDPAVLAVFGGTLLSIYLTHLWPMAVGLGAWAVLLARRNRSQSSNATLVIEALAGQDPARAIAFAREATDPSVLHKVEEILRGWDQKEQALQGAIRRERMKSLELELHAGELDDARVRLEHANRDLEAFTYSASHDLGAPLRTIEAFASLLVSGDLEGENREFAQSIEQTAGRLLALIQDLLVISRLNPPALVDVHSISLGDIVGEIADDLQSDLNADSRLIVDGVMPQVEVPAERVRQILSNLIRNGFKFNRSHPAQVTVQGWNEGEMTVIRVSDNGIGIPGHDHEQVFGLFTRLHGSSEFPGSGAGLAIARRAARSLGGELWIESSGPGGTTFALAFPSRYRPDLPPQGIR